jgi:hypothetical protein
MGNEAIASGTSFTTAPVTTTSTSVTSTTTTIIDLTSGLIAYYPFNGNANDESGSIPANNGLPIEAALTTDRFGNPNSAYILDGLNDYIKTNQPLTFNDQNVFSAVLWVKIPESYPSSNYEEIIQIQGAQFGGQSNCAQIFIEPDNIALGWYAEGSNNERPDCPNCWYLRDYTVRTDQWIQIAGVWNRSGNSLTAKLYINGTLLGTKNSGLLLV